MLLLTDPGMGGAGDQCFLSFIDRQIRWSEVIAGPGLNLDKYDDLPNLGDDVYLSPFITPVKGEDAVAFVLEVFDGQPLSLITDVVLPGHNSKIRLNVAPPEGKL